MTDGNVVDRIRGLILAEIRRESSPDDTARLLASSADDRVAAVHSLLADLLDLISDFEYERAPGAFLHGCEDAVGRLMPESDPEQPRIAGLLAFLCLNIKLLERRFDSPSRERIDNADAYCSSLFELSPVAPAVQALYRPGGRPGSVRRPSEIELRKWNELDLSTCSYYRAGTTSFIVKVNRALPDDESGYRPDLVLKCVLFPWSRLSAVAQATDEYAARYGGSRTPGVVVHPEASTEQWVLMPFQEGPTLADHLRDFEVSDDAGSPGLRVAEARRIGLALIDALDELAGEQPVDVAFPERQHLDLSPGNIILDRKQNIHFIDLGVNHLYSRQIGIAEHDDAVYIAPEIKNRGRSEVADVYSIGIIMTQILTGEAPRDGHIPDRVYEISPMLGRMLDDLIDEDPRNRVLLLPCASRFAFGPLRREMEFTFELADQESETSPRGFRRWLARLLPASREVTTQFAKWNMARRAGAAHNAYLLIFALVSTTAWWLICARTALFKVDDTLTFNNNELPTGDKRAAAIIAFTQALLAAKFYSMILARLTARHVPGLLARITEFGIRSVCVIAVPTVLVTVAWKPNLWAWGSTAGAVAIAATNLVMLILCRRLLDAGRRSGLSTVPPAGSGVPRGFEQWWWTMLLYAVCIACIAAGLQSGYLHDRDGYVLALTLVSLGIHYLSKFVEAGYGVRGGLARALAIGERVAILHRRDQVPIAGWPPRLVGNVSRTTSRAPTRPSP